MSVWDHGFPWGLHATGWLNHWPSAVTTGQKNFYRNQKWALQCLYFQSDWNVTVPTNKFRLLFQLHSIFSHKLHQFSHHIYKSNCSQTINSVFYKMGGNGDRDDSTFHHSHWRDDHTLLIERPRRPKRLVRRKFHVHGRVERIQGRILWLTSI